MPKLGAMTFRAPPFFLERHDHVLPLLRLTVQFRPNFFHTKGNKGHEDRLFEQELTEETEDSLTPSVASLSSC